MTVIKVDIKDVREVRPGFDLVEYERGTDPLDGYVLYGFDEIGQFIKQNAEYAFVGQ
jgi:hypothetical protein|tara:strand:+ start:563 stop:733 length:171 start_codon:yes stop_codon:yes gene_type:complete